MNNRRVIKVSKLWIKLITANYIFSLIIIAIRSLNIFSDVFIGIAYLILDIPIFIKLIKENKLFSPFLSNVVFDFAFSLYLMMLVKGYYRMTFFELVILASCSYVWKLVICTSSSFTEGIYNSNRGIVEQKINRKNFTLIISALFLISTLAMLFEWRMAGGVPALRSDSETFRFTTSYSSYTHFLAIQNKIVAALIGSFLVCENKVSIKRDFILILEMIIAEIMMIGTAMRGEMIFAPVIIFAVYIVKNKLSFRKLIFFSIIAIAFVGLYPIIRMYSSYGTSYIESIKSISVYKNLYAFIPLYQSFSNNFSILKLDFNIFPELVPFGFGEYYLLPQIPFADLGTDIGAVQNQVLHNNFYSGLTATYLSTWYADLGFFGCFLATIIFARLTTYAWEQYDNRRTLFSLIFYVYTFYTSLWMFYATTFDIVYVMYSLIIWIVLKLCTSSNRN